MCVAHENRWDGRQHKWEGKWCDPVTSDGLSSVSLGLQVARDDSVAQLLHLHDVVFVFVVVMAAWS